MEPQKPSIGRIVHVCIGLDTEDTPVVRPAIVVRVQKDNAINVQCFLDGSDDSDFELVKQYIDMGTRSRDEIVPLYIEHVSYSETPKVWYWSWPPRV